MLSSSHRIVHSKIGINVDALSAAMEWSARVWSRQPDSLSSRSRIVPNTSKSRLRRVCSWLRDKSRTVSSESGARAGPGTSCSRLWDR